MKRSGGMHSAVHSGLIPVVVGLSVLWFAQFAQSQDKSSVGSASVTESSKPSDEPSSAKPQDDRPRSGMPPIAEPKEKESTHAQKVASARDLSAAFRAAAARMIPCVVTIFARTRDGEDSGIVDIVGGTKGYDSVGSGVILDSSGLILTNHHVIDKAVHIEVKLNDGRQYEAVDPRSDSRSDIAIIRIKAEEPLPFAEIGDANDVSVGDWVLAIGSPFQIEATVSAGIISAKHGLLHGLVSGRILQTDAAINPGNSGGPLIDLDGKVIGINTAISTTTGSFQGIGFAVPINRALWVKNELVERNRVRKGVLGVSSQALPLEIAKELHLPTQGGAYVTRTVKGRPAEKAGLLTGDIILSIDGQAVHNHEELASIVEESPIGRPIELVVLRSGERLTISVTLDARD